MKNKFASDAILFQKTFEYMNAINICNGYQTTHL
jgi:hypothetical protein